MMGIYKNFLLLLISLLLIDAKSLHVNNKSEKNSVEVCSLPDSLIEEIESYEETVNEIVKTAVNGTLKGFTWKELEFFVDKFGSRFTGTQNLENSINYMLEKSRNLSLENVHGEPVMVPQWVRGSESATLLLPRLKDIALLGLGYSIGTPIGGITASVIVVRSFAELKQRKNEIPGKIVVYNQEFETYGKSVKYRSRGASEAAKYGAVAALIRSVTPFSMYTPHTGMMSYAENITKIPAACITVEDAKLLYRLQKRGEPLKIKLKMQAKMLPESESQNAIAEIQGNVAPEKVVVLSGHIDSWDVGQGAMDDGGGAFISWSSLVLLKKLNLRPKRTIRAIMWTAEEMGIIGASQYIKNHEAERNNFQFLMESDFGTFKPLGLVVSGNNDVQCIVQKILSLLKPLGKLKVQKGSDGPDIGELLKMGVPGASLMNKNEKYFWYHHTQADTIDIYKNTADLDQNTALFAAVGFVMANLSIDLPHEILSQ
ncbi:carboxypeptidase Q-like [Leptopilina heterotoma]|uniref:carboxypeptidase Q-like n=1 Tax=Leptopilina heterotoma TaxID=63436 RepID=UPI001CA7EA70|nr:carboxypeptidase Q-like [Leptopilina heterotoma]